MACKRALTLILGPSGDIALGSWVGRILVFIHLFKLLADYLESAVCVMATFQMNMLKLFLFVDPVLLTFSLDHVKPVELVLQVAIR